MYIPPITIQSKLVKPIILATFPDYRKRKVYLKSQTEVTLSDLNWSGGSKSEYRACTIDGKEIPSKYNLGGPAPWNNPFEGKKIDIPIGVVIVEGGFFCGKERTLYLYINPANMPKYLKEEN